MSISGRTVASHVPALDGVRGAAVLLVIGYHCAFLVSGVETRIFTGGWIGVDVFFVLSGYLITSGLLAGFDRQQPTRLRLFYRRRFWRLGPALIMLLAFWLILTQSGVLLVLQPGNPPHPVSASLAWLPVIGMLTLSYNWWLAYDMPSPDQMDHIWSLGIEEQFYLVWPCIIGQVFRRAAHPKRALQVVCVLGVTLALALSLWAADTGRRDFAYFATVTRMLGLLLGAAVALEISAGGARHADGVSKSARVAAVCALVALFLLGLTVPDDNRKLVPVVSVVTALGAAVMIRRIVLDPAARAHWFGGRWLRWCGRRSYALYLWDWPAVAICRERIIESRLAAVTAVIIAFGCAALSWRLVESRFAGRGRDGLRPENVDHGATRSSVGAAAGQ